MRLAESEKVWRDRVRSSARGSVLRFRMGVGHRETCVRPDVRSGSLGEIREDQFWRDRLEMFGSADWV